LFRLPGFDTIFHLEQIRTNYDCVAAVARRPRGGSRIFSGGAIKRQPGVFVGWLLIGDGNLEKTLPLAVGRAE